MIRSVASVSGKDVTAAAADHTGDARMSKRTLGLSILCGWLIASGAAQAHHSLAGVYDIRKEGEVSGVLTKVAFTNPHGAMHLTVKNADGTITEWTMTTGSANTLANLGFGTGGPNTVKAGDEVTIKYFPARNGAALGFIRSITLADHREIQISSGSSTD
jgi:hypothetical protein